MKRDLTVSFVKGNLLGFLMIIPVTLLGVLYVVLWHQKLAGGYLLDIKTAAVCLAAVIIGAFAHELIHMACAVYFGKIGLDDLRFGIDLKTLSPYFHCKIPLEVTVYRKVSAMPGILLGLVPSLVGLITGYPWMMFFGLLFILAAGGDMLILWLLRNIKPGTLVEDHSSRIGCYVIEDDSAS